MSNRPTCLLSTGCLRSMRMAFHGFPGTTCNHWVPLVLTEAIPVEGNMIARIWRTMVDEARAEEYEIFARTVSLPMFRSQQGYVGVIMARQEETCVVMSFWKGIDDVNRLGASATYRDTVGQILSMGFLHGEQTTEILDVHLSDFSALGSNFQK